MEALRLDACSRTPAGGAHALNDRSVWHTRSGVVPQFIGLGAPPRLTRAAARQCLHALPPAAVKALASRRFELLQLQHGALEREIVPQFRMRIMTRRANGWRLQSAWIQPGKGPQMNSNQLAVATFDDHMAAEDAVKALHRAGFDMKHVSIVGKDYTTEEQVVGFFNAGDRAKFLGKFGAFWGGMFGMLFGTALLFVPVVGHIVVLGPLATMIVAGVEAAVVTGGIGALVGALSALGVPRDSVLRYETAIKANKFLLVVHGDADDIRRAHDVLAATDLKAFAQHGNSQSQTEQKEGAVS